MKKAIIALAATSVLVLSACGNSSETIVSTKAGDVTKEEFYDAMKQQAGQNVIKNLVIQKVFTKNYKVADKDVEAEYKKTKEQYGDQFDSLLEQSGMTETSLKEQIRASLAVKKAIGATITEKELKAQYKPEIRASHILVKDEDTAKKVEAELAAGKSFEDLAKQYSEDTASKENGGDLDYFGPGKMEAAFEEAAYKLKKGEISQPVKTSYGYHIIKVTDIKELKPYDEVKDDLKTQIIETKMADTTFMNDFIDKELKKADVNVKDKTLKPAFETQAATGSQ
ncbi:peptidylprolyl isomerase PrsA [Ectobacillus funiculus]|uniref:peptidylprolyl isomerase PrsA n=1 Tax=Ectobacillus funiculus TaxID=137993 RepID=UPI00397C33A7